MANGMDIMMPTSTAVDTGSATIETNGSVSFSGVGYVALNGVFTSTYTNYMMIVTYSPSGAGAVYMRLRASGVDAAASGDYLAQTYVISSSSKSTSALSTQTFLSFNTAPASTHNQAVIYVYSPQASTAATSFRVLGHTGTASPTINEIAGVHKLTTSYDGITFSQTGTSAGFGAGRVTVFGLVS